MSIHLRLGGHPVFRDGDKVFLPIIRKNMPVYLIMIEYGSTPASHTVPSSYFNDFAIEDSAGHI